MVLMRAYSVPKLTIHGYDAYEPQLRALGVVISDHKERCQSGDVAPSPISASTHEWGRAIVSAG